jgi:hypothetical protein
LFYTDFRYHLTIVYLCTSGNFYKNTQFSRVLKILILLYPITFVINKSKFTLPESVVYIFNSYNYFQWCSNVFCNR